MIGHRGNVNRILFYIKLRVSKTGIVKLVVSSSCSSFWGSTIIL